MSRQLINRSQDLKRLVDEGYEVEIRSSFLLVHHIPYVNNRREVRFGTLVSELTLAGDMTTRPGTHVVSFIGEQPCGQNGVEIEGIKHATGDQRLAEGLIVNRSFSNKPAAGYPDYYEKIKRYVDILSHPAQSLDPRVTAQTYVVVPSEGDVSPFVYLDTNSSRAEISAISEKLRNLKVGVIGLGGTGAYVLDSVSKTPVSEIHLFDGDDFLQHNAFRSPSAASIDDLRKKLKKADYYQSIYRNMHTGVMSHPVFIDSENINTVLGLDFVFICVDSGDVRKLLFESLESQRIPFIDVGIGLFSVDERLVGNVRTTISLEGNREDARRVVPFAEGLPNEYAKNIQTPDLNMLNAALAVIRWKKYFGFYHESANQGQYSVTYTVEFGKLFGDGDDS